MSNLLHQSDSPVHAPESNTVMDAVGNRDYEKGGSEYIEDTEKTTIDDSREADRFGTIKEYTVEERKLVRKLDTYILPIIFAMYYMNKTDQHAIANAKLGTLTQDLHLKGNEFNVCVSVLYVGYCIIQLPSNMLMSSRKVRPSTWMSIWVFLWAAVSACTAACTKYHSLLAVRFLLGFTEAPFYPGALLLLSMFYTRREIATHISILYSANIFATAFAGLITAAVFNTLDQKHDITGWRWLFIILGVVTAVVAIAAFFILPDHPSTTHWLSPRERILAQERIDRDTVGLEIGGDVLRGFKQALKDPRLWLFVPMQTMHLAACGFNSFFPTVVKTLGYSTTITLVITCPVYFLAGFFAIALGWSSGRHNEKT